MAGEDLELLMTEIIILKWISRNPIRQSVSFICDLKVLERSAGYQHSNSSRLRRGRSVASDPGSVPSWAAIGLSPLFLWCACQELLPVIPRAWLQVLVYPVNLSCFLVLCSLQQLIWKQYTKLWFSIRQLLATSKADSCTVCLQLNWLILGESPQQQNFRPACF